MQDDRLQRSLGHALVRAFRSVNRASNRAVQRFGLSAEQAHILLFLWQRGPMRVGDLQRLLALSSGTLTGALDRMEKAGLVRRTKHPEDGRAFRVEPAPFDARRRRAIEDALEAMEDEAFRRFSAAERETLLGFLGRLSEDEGDAEGDRG
jgi:DNA-binding MarR family transcriptional regulator